MSIVPLTPGRCPADPEGVAERYCMGSLDKAEALAFEEHYLSCARCASIVEDAEHFTRAMKIAAQRLRPAKAKTSGASGAK